MYKRLPKISLFPLFLTQNKRGGGKPNYAENELKHQMRHMPTLVCVCVSLRVCVCVCEKRGQ